MNSEMIYFGFDSQHGDSEILYGSRTSHQQDELISAQQVERKRTDKRGSCFSVQRQCLKVIQERRRNLERLLGLLHEDGKGRYLIEYGNSADISHISDCSQQPFEKISAESLWRMDFGLLEKVLADLKQKLIYANNKLINASEQRDYYMTKQEANYHMITATLRSVSENQGLDTKLQFSLDPPSNEIGFRKWVNAMKAVARLPNGIPHYFRQNVWAALANHYSNELGIGWEEFRYVAFSDKDLNRTEQLDIKRGDQKLHLKRVLLGYAGLNKVVGYCQEYSVIAALILEVMDYDEEMTLKVMIFLIKHVLPHNYFEKSLLALSVDMAVLKDLLYQTLPITARHLDDLQRISPSPFEPPLANVFSIQWILTLFTTCLPKSCLFRVWDALMLEGSEVLLRTSLVIWAKLNSEILKTKTADEFYTLMGSSLCTNIMQMQSTEINDFIGIIYTMSVFPYPSVLKLRERHKPNMQPFTSSYFLFQHQVNTILHISYDEETGTNSFSSTICNTGFKATKIDSTSLISQSELLKQRQKQVALISHAVCGRNLMRYCGKIANSFESIISKQTGDQEKPMFNHLLLGTELAHCRENWEGASVVSTLCGKLPVLPQFVQPINEDAMKAQITLSKDGQACFMINSNQQDNCDSSVKNVIFYKVDERVHNEGCKVVKIDMSSAGYDFFNTKSFITGVSEASSTFTYLDEVMTTSVQLNRFCGNGNLWQTPAFVTDCHCFVNHEVLITDDSSIRICKCQKSVDYSLGGIECNRSKIIVGFCHKFFSLQEVQSFQIRYPSS